MTDLLGVPTGVGSPDISHMATDRCFAIGKIKALFVPSCHNLSFFPQLLCTLLWSRAARRVELSC